MSLGSRDSTVKPTGLISRRSSTPLQLRVGGTDGILNIQLVRHDADETEPVLHVTDRLRTHTDHAGQCAEGGSLVLAAYRTSSIIFLWLPRATAVEDSHSAALLTSL